MPCRLIMACCLLLFQIAAASESPVDSKLVFLQGSPAQELSELVIGVGAEVTHNLHLIDAVGAKVSAEQLATILESPLIERHIDDLTLDAEEDPEGPAEVCEIGGALEVSVDGNALSWPIYNHTGKNSPVTRLELKWPTELGKIQSLRHGHKIVDTLKAEHTEDGGLDIALSPGELEQSPGRELLIIEFENEIGPKLAQRDFEIKMHFHKDCDTKLIPGYADNHLDTYYPTVVGAAQLHRLGVTGKGVTVAVIDSGLWHYPGLTSDTGGNPRILAHYDAIADLAGSEAFDGSGHGTHMSSIIADSQPVTRSGVPAGSFKGIAPDASIVAVKVLHTSGQGYLLDIARGIQWVIDNRQKYGIDIINLSIASPPRWPYWLDPINQMVMHAWAAGITVVASAGNEGPDPLTIGAPGNIPYVITVGAVTDSWTADQRDDDYIPDFSSHGPTPSGHIKPDLVAPGGHMTGMSRPDSTLLTDNPEYQLRTGEWVMSGTSQATALVSGIAALLLQLEPGLSPDDIKCKLTSSAEPAINRDGLLAYSPFKQGHGYVSATRAVTLGEKGCANNDMEIKRDLAGETHYEGPAEMDENEVISLPGLDQMLSPEVAAKGMSDTRKWGVKDHLERPDFSNSPPAGPTDNSSGPFNWRQIYIEEVQRVERLKQ